MKIDPNAPAYPCPSSTDPNGNIWYPEPGMPIRLAIAAQIMAAIEPHDISPSSVLACIGLPAGTKYDFKVHWPAYVAKAALARADALIAAHNATEAA